MGYSASGWQLSRIFCCVLVGVGIGDGLACSSTGNCEPRPTTRQTATAISAETLRDILALGGTERERCFRLCGWDVETCSISYDRDALMKACQDSVQSGGAPGNGDNGVSGSGAGESNAGCRDVLLSIACSAPDTIPCVGRRHVSWKLKPASVAAQASSAALWYARAAANEAGSVRSFRALAGELRDSSIGRRFAKRLRNAARDEISHARLMREEARRRGAEPLKHDFRAHSGRSLLEISVENAREGCVEETWAALVAHVQARRASTVQAKRLFAQIAQDETRHAELAWDLHLELKNQLGEDERATLNAALNQSIEQLAASTTDSFLHLPHELGLPNPDMERALRTKLADALRLNAKLVVAHAEQTSKVLNWK